MEYLSDIILRHARERPHIEAVVFEKTRLNFEQFNERINRLANGFVSKGFKKGDHIGFLAENCHQYLEAYYAMSRAGMVTVPLNYRLSERELIYIINHSESKALIVDKKHLPTVRNIRADLERVELFIGVDAVYADMLPYEKIIEAGAPDEPDRKQLNENDMAILMYTGGTTGLPKGVMLSNKNLLASVKSVGGDKVYEGIRSLFALPLFHIANWQAFLYHYFGGCVIVSRRADPEEVVRLLVEEKPMMVNLVPAVYQFMLQLPNIEEMDLSHVRVFSVGGAQMPAETMKKCEQVFGMRPRKGYGLTEAAPSVSRLTEHQYAMEGDPKLVKRANSVGKPLKTVQVKIRREDGSECDVEEEGQITVFGDNVMLGYWRDPERTREAIRNGWLWTGDIGYMDEDGFIFLVDRKDDMIISGGENVYPNEVENALYEHPAVLEAAVVGVPDERWGEAVKAVIVLKQGQSATEEELIEFCKKRIARYKSPKSIDFVDELPKTTVGKIRRGEVKKHYSKEA